jgi:hypothetical protein
MSFKYQEAVPWGRSFDEYRRMFNLSDADLGGKILGCADGPSGFNAGMFQRGLRVVSCDPLYACSAEQIKERIDATYENVMDQARRNQDKFVWDVIPSVEELGRARRKGMEAFLADYEAGRRAGRYVAAELPKLPFPAASFDLALCSHFLFFYADNYSLAFHQAALAELCRVAGEVRIFPLLNYNAEPCPYVEPITEWLKKSGRLVSIEKVEYEFQRGGNRMLRVRGI